MAERAAPTEQAIFLFQSMMLDDEGMMNEVRFCIIGIVAEVLMPALMKDLSSVFQ